jgi:hypothetical protein
MTHIPVPFHYDRSRPRMRPSCNGLDLPQGCPETGSASRKTPSRLKTLGPGAMIDPAQWPDPAASIGNPSPDTQAAN